MIVAGTGIYERCGYCMKLVKVNKFIFGDMHICLSESDRNAIDYEANKLKKYRRM